MPKPCLVPAPTTAKLPHASGHSSGNRQGHVTKTKAHRFKISVAFRFTNAWFLLNSWHHLYIFSYYHSFNGISSLANYMAKLLWEWKLAVPSSCVVTQTSMETNSGTRRRKRKFPLLFENCDRGRIEIDHLCGLHWSGWYCNPEQHSLCRPARRRPAQLVLFWIAVPTTPVQTVSWSIPITMTEIQISISILSWWN